MLYYPLDHAMGEPDPDSNPTPAGPRSARAVGYVVGRERSWGARLGAGSGHAREARQRQHGSWLQCLGDEQPVPELQVARVPVDDRLEVDDHRLVDADGVRPAAADGLQRRRVCEVPRAARRLRARRREASLGGARWPRLSCWGGTVIAGDGLKARWPGDGGARSRVRERGSGGVAANRRLASSGDLGGRLGRVN